MGLLQKDILTPLGLFFAKFAAAAQRTAAAQGTADTSGATPAPVQGAMASVGSARDALAKAEADVEAALPAVAKFVVDTAMEMIPGDQAFIPYANRIMDAIAAEAQSRKSAVGQ